MADEFHYLRVAEHYPTNYTTLLIKPSTDELVVEK